MSEDEIRQQLCDSGLCKNVSGRGHIWTTEKGKIFVKIGTGGADANVDILKYEAEGLSRMANAATLLHIPKPWLVGSTSKGKGFIVMDYIDFGGGRTKDAQTKLGKGLAQMHMAPADHPTFGFPMDGCCGSSRQLNNVEQRNMNWVEFWQEFRLGDRLAVLRENAPRDKEIQEKGAQLVKRVPELFSMMVVEDIVPSLLHGDLWSGNYATDAEGNPCIFDPACYYGHSEAELGIANMFGGFSSACWDAYFKELPKAPGFDARALLYELQHHLNHYCIFGGGYRSGSLSIIDQLLAQKSF